MSNRLLRGHRRSRPDDQMEDSLLQPNSPHHVGYGTVMSEEEEETDVKRVEGDGAATVGDSGNNNGASTSTAGAACMSSDGVNGGGVGGGTTKAAGAAKDADENDVVLRFKRPSRSKQPRRSY